MGKTDLSFDDTTKNVEKVEKTEKAEETVKIDNNESIKV